MADETEKQAQAGAEKAPSNNPFAAFCKTLNSHGYGFHYAVLRKAMVMWNGGQSRWLFEVSEFPVEARGQGTRIDFVLHYNNTDLYLVAECKRANRALVNWCFAKAPFVQRDKPSDIIAQKIVTSGGGQRRAKIATHYPLPGYVIYHVALEFRSQEPGDQHGSGRGTIEEAATQVCRGLNGLVNFWAENSARDAIFLPVIFTTARLYTTEIDLSRADLATGTFDPSKGQIKKADWLLYQYHQSPGLRHSLSSVDKIDENRLLGDYLWNESARTIAVVGPTGIEDFLTRLNWWEILKD
ncbi:MAG: hypothetical protein ABSA67_11265 [Candidatus Brocadiia bacterium]